MRCPRCRHELLEGELVCPRCGEMVVTNRTKTNQFPENMPADMVPISGRTVPGNEPVSAVGFHIRGVQKVIKINQLSNVVMGRIESSVMRDLPNFDLSSFGAGSRGVSRRHIRLNFEDGRLWVTDLGSSNGTRLNGEKLTPDQPYVVNDGAELMLGQLSIGITYLR